MFERDYLMRLILGYFKTIVVVVKRGNKEKDPEGAADLLECAIGEATEIDGDVLLSLSPESIAGILQVSGTDPKVIGYVAHGLLLESHYLMLACDFARAELREGQARALADAYGIDLPDDPAKAEEILLEAAKQGLLDDGEGADGPASLVAEAERIHDVARRDEASLRFDPDAPLMQHELHEQGRFGWEGEGGRSSVSPDPKAGI